MYVSNKLEVSEKVGEEESPVGKGKVWWMVRKRTIFLCGSTLGMSE